MAVFWLNKAKIMKKKDTHKRSYGYEKGEEKRKSRDYGNTRRTSKKSSQTFDWMKLFLIPLRIIGFILVFVYTFFKNLLFKGKNGASIARGAFKLGVRLAILGFIGIVILFLWAGRGLPDPDKLADEVVAQSTKIYDRSGEHLLYEVFAKEKRTVVELEDIPAHLIQAVIATEDTKFYEHKGIRPLSLARSVIYGALGKGRVGGGASTLTQQLVKNAILTPERTVTRKIKEIILSIRLEQKYTKDQILKIYFNEIPYGSTNYGVESAAQSYFGKTVSDLDLQEAATLAGLPRAPSIYLRNKDALKNRRDFVLGRMHAEGYITAEEKTAAQNMPVSLERVFNDIQAPHFVLWIKDQLVEEYGEQMVDTGGLKVITSLDWEKQQAAQDVVEEVGTNVLEKAGANNTALVSVDPKNGHILAMIGSKDFSDESIDGQFDVVTLGRRQPGSSFKPIVYAGAFEKGYTPETVVFDVVTNFAASGRGYTPLNYDLQERGPVSLRQSLQGSLNIPAVKTLYLLGEKKGIEFAERLGYTTFKAGNFGLSLVLGGGEVNMLEHVNAFAAFANSGVQHEITSIIKVEDASGKVLQEWKQEKGNKIIEPEVAHTISNVMSDDAARAYAFGAGGPLTLPGRPVAAKTGTTNSYIDGWTIGYTPSLVTLVWGGNTDNTPMKRGFGGSSVAAPIWNAYMRKALENSPVEAFPPAPKNDAKKPALRGAEGGNITLKINKVTGNIATSSTPKKYVVERTYIQPHSILHYLLASDPRGDVPSDPGIDPQYAIWEASIQDWIARKKEEDPEWDVSFEEPPIKEDDLYSLELIPTLNVIYPTPSTTIVGRELDTDIRVSAPRGVTRVTYKIDGKPIGVVTEFPFNLNHTMDLLDPGQHTLNIVVEDDVGNKLDEEIPFILDVAPTPPGISWVTGNQTVAKDDFPRTIFFKPHKAEEIEQMTFVLVSEEDDRQPLGSQKPSGESMMSFSWNEYPGKGTWRIETMLELKQGPAIVGDSITFQVK